MGVEEWGNRYVRLTKAMGVDAEGPYRATYTPWQREIFKAYENRRITNIIVVGPAQGGKSMPFQIITAWTIDNDPQNILYFMDTDTNARYASRKRIQPFLDSIEHLRAKVAPSKRRHVFDIPFAGGSLMMSGAGSTGQLGSKSASVVIRDETGKWPEKQGREAGALENAGERVEGQYYFKLIDLSTPVMEGDPILKQYALSDGGVLHVPCPLCGGYQELVWEQIKWPRDPQTSKSCSPLEARRNAWYECIHCKGHIAERSKRWMLRNYRRVVRGQTIQIVTAEAAAGVEDWTVTLPDGTARRYQLLGKVEFNPRWGLHFSRLYVVWRTWGELAQRWLEIGEDLSKRQAFINSSLARPWRMKALTPESSVLATHIDPDLPAGVVPDGYELITMGADVQKAFIRYGVYAWREDRARAMIERGEVAGFEDLEMLLYSRYRRRNGEGELGVRMMFLDAGYRTTEVYDFCRGRQNCMACRGVDSPGRGPVSASVVKRLPDGRELPAHLQLAVANVYGDGFKDEFFAWLEEAWTDRTQPPPERYIRFHAATPAAYLESLTGEKRIETRDVRGRVRTRWHRLRDENHDLDAMVYAAAASFFVNHLFLEERRRREWESRQHEPRDGRPVGHKRLRTKY